MKKEVARKFLVFVGISLFFVASLFFLSDGVRLTGDVILTGNLTTGVYTNTEWNGSSIVLYEDNLTGNYVSEIYDLGGDSVWNNLTFVGGGSDVEYFFAVDGGGDVYSSSDFGVTWTSVLVDYGRTTDTQYMFSDSSSIYIISNSNKEVWRSDDWGVSFAVVNNSFADSALLVADVDSSGNLFAVDGSGDIYLSNDSGVTWNLQGDFNGGSTSNAKGIAINSSDSIFVVDGSGSVYVSVDLGVEWVEQTSAYGGGAGTDDMEVSNGNLFILFNEKVYTSSDFGVTWSVVNETFSSYANDGLRMGVDSNSDVYIADASGRVFNSSDSGVLWQELGDLNAAAGSDPKGLTFLVRPTTMNFEVKNCSLSDCSGGVWQVVSLDDINLTGRYFQYRVNFTSPDSTLSSHLDAVSIGYDVLNTAPVIDIVLPLNGSSYGYNESLNLTFTVTDSDSNLDSCWYNINSGANVSIAGCLNVTFSVAGDGNYTLVIYANDTSGLTTSDEVDFSVQIGAPTIILSSPIALYLNNSTVVFNYTPSDVDLETCSLWGNFSGVYGMNETNVSVLNGVVNNFVLNLSDGGYFWNVGCNDTLGNSAYGVNNTFYVDTVVPVVNVTEPVGTKASRDLNIVFSAQDINLDSCWYNVYRGVSVEVANTSIDCLSSPSFSVTVDADFVINLYVNDSAGNIAMDNSSFSVDTSSSPPPVEEGGSSGGGGSSSGGGGSFSGIFSTKDVVNLEVSAVGGILIPGVERSLIVTVKNNGNKAVNKCGIKSDSDIEFGDLQNIASGEIVEFPFILKATDSSPLLWIDCLEGVQNISVDFTLFVSGLSVTIEKIELGESEIVVEYSVESDSDFEGLLNFRVNDMEGGLITVIAQEVRVVGGEIFRGSVVVALDSGVDGLLNVAIVQGDDVLIEDTIVYGSVGIGTGFAVANLFGGGDLTYVSLLVLFFMVIGFFVVKRIVGNLITNHAKEKKG